MLRTYRFPLAPIPTLGARTWRTNHGTVVPPILGRRLYDVSPNPCTFCGRLAVYLHASRDAATTARCSACYRTNLLMAHLPKYAR